MSLLAPYTRALLLNTQILRSCFEREAFPSALQTQLVSCHLKSMNLARQLRDVPYDDAPDSDYAVLTTCHNTRNYIAAEAELADTREQAGEDPMMECDYARLPLSREHMAVDIVMQGAVLNELWRNTAFQRALRKDHPDVLNDLRDWVADDDFMILPSHDAPTHPSLDQSRLALEFAIMGAAPKDIVRSTLSWMKSSGDALQARLASRKPAVA